MMFGLCIHGGLLNDSVPDYRVTMAVTVLH